MSDQINNILTYLQNIQHDLVGIIVPAVIAATVSLLSLLISSIISIVQQKEKYNHEQFKYMQRIFPFLKLHLQQMKLAIEMAQTYSTSFGDSISTALKNYRSYIADSNLYRRNHQSASQEIDKFILFMEKYIATTTELHQIFMNEALPSTPLLHPVFKKKIQKMVVELQYWSYFLPQLNDTSLDTAFLDNEVCKCTLDSNELQKYILLLDVWYQAY